MTSLRLSTALSAAALWLLLVPAEGHATEPENDGATLYHDFCSVCHGDRGDGDSRARGSMRPPPRDFTTVALDRDRMIRSVREGRPGTAMVPWRGQLRDEQIEAIVDYIRAKLMRAQAPPEGDAGAQLYARNCSVCHGDDGGGAVWATTSLMPRPRDFTSALAADELTRERMLHAATYGRPDTAMPGFGTQLEAGEIEAVVDHIRARLMPGAATAEKPLDEHAAGHTGHAHAWQSGDDAHSQPFPHGLRGDLERGEDLYRANCVACHGAQGNGRGPRAYFILPKPRNFTHPAARSALNRPHLFASISKGNVGTEMPAWEKVLDRQAIADVAEFVYRRFVAPDTGAHSEAASAPAHGHAPGAKAHAH